MTRIAPTVGEHLANGAVVIASTDTHVLAHWPLNKAREAGEYVTWRYSYFFDGDHFIAEAGNYYQWGPTWGATQVQALQAALTDLKRRH